MKHKFFAAPEDVSICCRSKCKISSNINALVEFSLKMSKENKVPYYIYLVIESFNEEFFKKIYQIRYDKKDIVCPIINNTDDFVMDI